MCTQKEQKIISHFNRALIALAGIGGVMADGFHGGDVLCTVSMLVWLWQSECCALEATMLDKIRHRVKSPV